MSNTERLLLEIKKSVRKHHPDAKIFLYGSRVKGNYNVDSDWDLLILLNQTQISPEIEESITHPLYYLEIDFGEVISPMVYSEKEWNSKYAVTSFYRNVMNEGRQL